MSCSRFPASGSGTWQGRPCSRARWDRPRRPTHTPQQSKCRMMNPARRRSTANRGTLTPELAASDRVFLASTLNRMRRAVTESGRPEQLLHGEPHPGNLISTRTGPLFIDFETCCRGLIEFDLAHAPDDVGDHYPGADHRLLKDCRTLVLSMITAWRWDRDDQFPDGHRLGIEWLSQLRTATSNLDG
nr:phosphotransferase [Actinoplanes sp. M2I2]